MKMQSNGARTARCHHAMGCKQLSSRPSREHSDDFNFKGASQPTSKPSSRWRAMMPDSSPSATMSQRAAAAPPSPSPAPLVLLLYGAGGGGHKASARAVRTALDASSAIASGAIRVQMADASARAGAAPGDWLYNVLLSHNAVSAIELFHSAVQFFWPLAIGPLRANFRAYWAQFQRLQCVVSFVPMLNAIFAESLPPHVHLITVLTDFSHTYTHPWIQHPRQHIVAGTQIAYAQALAQSFQPPQVPSPSMCVTRTSGMVVHPRFYNRLSSAARKQELARLNLHQLYPTVLILFGGSPPTDTVMELVTRLLSRPPPHGVNVIAVCASNTALLERLTRWKRVRSSASLCITGFTNQIPLLMQVSDVLIGKPGPGVVSEAFVSGLPLILITGDSDARVMKQEQDVLHWVRSNGIASIVHSCQQAAAVTQAQISQMREAIHCMEANNAVFEVRDLILNKLRLCAPPEAQTQRRQQVQEAQPEPEQAHQLQSHSSTIAPPSNAEQQQHQNASETDHPTVTNSTSVPTNQASFSASEGRRNVHGSPVGSGSRRRLDSLSPTTITALPSRTL